MKQLSPLILAVLLTGCVTSHHSAPVAEVYVPATPTSNRAETRVYAEPGVAVPAQPAVTTPSPNVSPADLAVAESVSELFTNDATLEPWASRIIARVENGVVTLRGTVPSTHDKQDIETRISQLPGVRRVDNFLEVSMR